MVKVGNSYLGLRLGCGARAMVGHWKGLGNRLKRELLWVGQVRWATKYYIQIQIIWLEYQAILCNKILQYRWCSICIKQPLEETWNVNNCEWDKWVALILRNITNTRRQNTANTDYVGYLVHGVCTNYKVHNCNTTFFAYLPTMKALFKH